METLRRIKAMHPRSASSWSRHRGDRVGADALGLGASDYVTKPFSLQYLASVLEDAPADGQDQPRLE